MSEFKQIPFESVEFANNPEPRCPCVLLLDTSGSMAGDKISELNNGLATFESELKSDPIAAKRVEVAIITFGPVKVVQEFVTADSFIAPVLNASGITPMGAAINEAISLIAERKNTYKNNGISYYRPWIFMITDGEPTDSITDAASAISEGESSKAFTFYAVGVERAKLETLSRISTRQPLKLRELSFRELFVWLSNSMKNVSKSQLGEIIKLDNPIAPRGWATID